VIVLLFLFGLFSPFLDIAIVAEAFMGVLAWGNRIATPSTHFHLFYVSDLLDPPLSLPQKRWATSATWEPRVVPPTFKIRRFQTYQAINSV